MYKDRDQLQKEIEGLQVIRQSLREKEHRIYTVLCLLISSFTFLLFIYLVSNKMPAKYATIFYISFSTNILACFYIIRELVKKTKVLYYNESSPLQVLEKKNEIYHTLPDCRLEELLESLLKNEKYEEASKVRDEIKARKN
jgi:hypothetical protein